MSTMRASMARSRVSGPVAPAHEPMEYTLTSKAQRELALISRQHDLKDLNAHLKYSQTALTDYAADINEKAYWKEHELQKRQRQSQNRRKKIKTQHGQDDDEDDGTGADTEANIAELKRLEERNAEFKDKVQAMTRRMDENIRKAIDGAQSIEELKECLEFTSSSAVQNSQRVQTARFQAAAQDAEDENEDEEDVTQITATGRSRAARERDATIELGPEPTKTLRERIERSAHKYQSMSLANRYSQHPDYVGFKQAVHEAQHDPENIPDLPPARTWFASSKSEPAPGMTQTADGDDDDDDVAVLQAKVSTKCPLTLLEFVDPVTSNACRHSFERSAIEELIGRSIQRQHGRTGEKIVQCPVPGCNAKISKQNLHKDNAILRKIQRIQEHQRRARDYEDEGGPRKSGAVEIESDSDDGDDGGQDIDDIMDDEEGAARRRTIKRFKNEPRGTQGRGQARQSAAPARSQAPNVVDLDGDSTEEDEAEEMEEDEAED